MSWLLGQAGVDFPPPKEFDDPNATVSAIMGGLRQLGLQLPGGPPPPTKLTQGWGPGVVAILEALVDAAFAARGLQRLRTPVYPNERCAVLGPCALAPPG